FVAETAALLFNDLCKQGCIVKNDWLADVNTQIFKRHGTQVCDLQLPQCLGRWRKRAAVVDSFEVCGYVQLRHLINRDVGPHSFTNAPSTFGVPIGGTLTTIIP